jgi:hypothetical protein
MMDAVVDTLVPTDPDACPDCCTPLVEVEP